MRKSRFISLFVVISLIFSVQVSGLHFAQSAVISIPGNVTVRAGTNTNYLNGSLTVSWDAVSAATAYAVIVTRAESTSFATVSVSGEKNTQAVITGLVGGASYVVQVRAIQDQDVSAWSSNSLIATPTTLPKAVNKPTAEAGIGSATVNWVALVGTENGGSNVTSYVISETNSGKSLSVAGNIPSVEFSDLTQGATAIFQVKVVTSVSSTGATSVASDEISILSSESVSAEPTASPSASAQPTSPIEVAPPSNSGGGSSSGGGGGGFGGGGFGGGGGGDAPLPLPSPPSTESASPTPSPKPSTFIPADKTPLQPSPSSSPRPTASSSRSPSPSSSASARNTKSSLVTTTSKVNLTNYSSSGKSAALTVKSSKNLSVTLPNLKKGSKIISKIRTPSGAVLNLATITVKKSGPIKLPTLDFKKPGIYKLVTSINGKSFTLKITIKK